MGNRPVYGGELLLGGELHTRPQRGGRGKRSRSLAVSRLTDSPQRLEYLNLVMEIAHYTTLYRLW
jgi:hypothetical protein